MDRVGHCFVWVAVLEGIKLVDRFILNLKRMINLSNTRPNMYSDKNGWIYFKFNDDWTSFILIMCKNFNYFEKCLEELLQKSVNEKTGKKNYQLITT